MCGTFHEFIDSLKQNLASKSQGEERRREKYLKGKEGKGREGKGREGKGGQGLGGSRKEKGKEGEEKGRGWGRGHDLVCFWSEIIERSLCCHVDQR